MTESSFFPSLPPTLNYNLSMTAEGSLHQINISTIDLCPMPLSGAFATGLADIFARRPEQVGYSKMATSL
jgi:hypothetical protein